MATGLRPAPLCALLVATSACAHAPGATPAASGAKTVRVGSAVFHLQYEREDAGAARQVERALGRAVGAAARWGTLSTPVRITIHPTHQALEAAVHRAGYAWLRGWARYASVDLQSPRTWSSGPASDAQVAQILAHEVTHSVMYQSVAAEGTWPSVAIPLWFKEGMASVAAEEERPRPSLEAVRRLYRERSTAPGSAGTDPLTGAGLLYQHDSDLIYGAADTAFRFLIERYGDDAVRLLMARMREGHRFGQAFQQAIGIPLQDFESEFRRYVAWGSARG
jgi:hypothetical protein